MADTTIKTGPIYQDKALVADFAEAVSPFFVNGGIISREFKADDTGDPSRAFGASDANLIVQIPGATEITFCEFQTATGVKIAHAITNLSGTAGKVATVAIGGNSIIRCLILYRV